MLRHDTVGLFQRIVFWNHARPVTAVEPIEPYYNERQARKHMDTATSRSGGSAMVDEESKTRHASDLKRLSHLESAGSVDDWV